MIALTARLNERDEMIMRLQEEVDAYDRHQRVLEDLLDQSVCTLKIRMSSVNFLLLSDLNFCQHAKIRLSKAYDAIKALLRFMKLFLAYGQPLGKPRELEIHFSKQQQNTLGHVSVACFTGRPLV